MIRCHPTSSLLFIINKQSSTWYFHTRPRTLEETEDVHMLLYPMVFCSIGQLASRQLILITLKSYISDCEENTWSTWRFIMTSMWKECCGSHAVEYSSPKVKLWCPPKTQKTWAKRIDRRILSMKQRVPLGFSLNHILVSMLANQ